VHAGQVPLWPCKALMPGALRTDPGTPVRAAVKGLVVDEPFPSSFSPCRPASVPAALPHRPASVPAAPPHRLAPGAPLRLQVHRQRRWPGDRVLPQKGAGALPCCCCARCCPALPLPLAPHPRAAVPAQVEGSGLLRGGPRAQQHRCRVGSTK